MDMNTFQKYTGTSSIVNGKRFPIQGTGYIQLRDKKCATVF